MQKNVVAVAFLIFSWLPLAFATVEPSAFTADFHLTDDFGDQGGNLSAPTGWPQATRGFTYYLYSQLKSILLSARTLDGDKFTAQEKVWMDQLIEKLPYFPASTNELTEAHPEWRKYQELLQMVDPKEQPIFDVASGTHRAAITQNSWNSVIYLNELLWEGEFRVPPYFGEVVNSQFASQVLTILVHEKVHHLGVPDDATGSLDKFGAKVAESFLKSSSFLNFLSQAHEPLSFIITSLAEVDQDCDQQKNRLLLIKRGVYDLTALVTRNLRGHFKIVASDLCKIKFSNPRSVGTPYPDYFYSPKGNVFNYRVQIDFSVKHAGRTDQGAIEFLISAYDNGIFTEMEKPAVKFKILPLQNRSSRVFEVVKAPADIAKGSTADFQIRIPKTQFQKAKLVLSSPNLVDFDWPLDRALRLTAANVQEDADSLLLDFTWDVPANVIRDKVVPVRLELDDTQVFFPQFIAEYAIKSPSKEVKGAITEVGFTDCTPPRQCKLQNPDGENMPFVVADWNHSFENTLVVKVRNFKDITQIRLIGYVWLFERIPNDKDVYYLYRGFQQGALLSENTPLIKRWTVDYDGDIATLKIQLSQPLHKVPRELVIEKLIIINSSEAATGLFLWAKLFQP